jgi:hypothetical protein
MDPFRSVRNLRGDSVTRSKHDHFVDQADEARGIGMANVTSFVKPVEMSEMGIRPGLDLASVQGSRGS